MTAKDIEVGSKWRSKGDSVLLAKIDKMDKANVRLQPTRIGYVFLHLRWVTKKELLRDWEPVDGPA